ncbi:MAG: T9SS type A sorting domain-containing protein [Rhodothermales bacterium]|nr:T9SS type A sorting domain-containing protein [Rhodothermales bacterium]
MRLSIIIIGLALLSHSAQVFAQGQMEARLETDKAVYEYGEPIEIRYMITNNTDSLVTLLASSSCQGILRFDDFLSTENATWTTDDLLIYFPPGGSNRTWTWIIDPKTIGLPKQDGTQKIIAQWGFRGRFADSLTVEAPQYLGGILHVEFATNAPEDSLDAMRNQLQATVLESRTSPFDQITVEKWEIEGITLEEATIRFESASFLHTVFPYRALSFHSVVAITPHTPNTIALQSTHPYPNPFTYRTTFDLTPNTAGPIRAVLYDLLGRERGVLFEGYLPAGAAQSVTIEAGDLPAGVYVYRVEAAGGVVAGKVVLRR